MRASEVHAVLNRELGPSMKEWGFQRTGSAMAIWRQPVDPEGLDTRRLFVAAHIGRTGFDAHRGGWFTIELWAGTSPDVAGTTIGNYASYFDFLSPEDKQRLLQLVNQARAVIPQYQDQKPESALNTSALYYYDAGHVTAYAAALRDMLPHIITVFCLGRDLLPPPKVTDAL